MRYTDLTTQDPNPVKRWLQHRRFADALGIFQKHRQESQSCILDFGGGNGELVRRLNEIAAIEATIFEPTSRLMDEARENLASVGSVTFADKTDAIESEGFDFVFCLEVFEHLPPPQTRHALAEIHRLLKPGGLAVIGVPHELFLPALLKGMFRMSRHHGRFDATVGNVCRAALGCPPSPRPVAEISPGVPFHDHHLGFDYRELEPLFRAGFRMEKKWFSPFPLLGAVLNSEVYFLLRKI